MEGAYRDALADYYGIPTFTVSTRIYYNRDLMEEIIGRDEAPTTYRELLAICERVQAFSSLPENVSRKIIPIAGSKYNAPYFTSSLFQSQVQTLHLEIIDQPPTLKPSYDDILLGYLKGSWSFTDTPQVGSGLQLMRDLGQYMQPGFLQLGREDSTLYFVQGRALMIATGSWDATSIMRQAAEAGFEVGVFKLPIPGKEDPEYGEYVLGQASEADTKALGAFGLYRFSENSAVAIDFMRFVTSQQGNQLFVDVSKWPPAILGVDPPPETEPFMPLMDGVVDGFSLTNSNMGPEPVRFVDNNLFKLLRRNGGVEDFVAAMEEGYGTIVATSLQEDRLPGAYRAVRQQDSTIAALAWQAAQGGATAEEANAKVISLLENQSGQDSTIAYLEYELGLLEAAGRLP
jgi:raffinose/stachyose/melibiose transport system substrate-binding protein